MDVRSRTTWGSRLRFLIRLVGLTAILVGGVGAVLAYTARPDFTTWTLPELRAGLTAGDRASWLLAVGAAAALFALLIEVFAGLFLAAGRRGAAGTFATAAILLAVGLFGFVNFAAFENHRRWDLTRDAQFTLPSDVRDELRELTGRTTVVVLRQHRMFGRFSDQSDLEDRKYEAAAEEKVVQKVLDRIEQFRTLGARFDVRLLDVNEDGFDQKLRELIESQPEGQRAALREAIAGSPQNSIIFFADGRAQRLSFNEFYQLDKTASREQGNLVLLPQGLGPFTSRIFAIEERRPRVGIGVVHQYLTSRSSESLGQYTMAGARKALEAQGFEVVDIVLKQGWTGREEPKPAAFTYAEARLGFVEAELESTRRELATLRRARDRTREDLDLLRGAESLAELDQKVPLRLGRRWTQELRREGIRSDEAELDRIADRIAEAERDEARTEAELASLISDERTVEAQRMTDFAEKLRRELNEIDLLILPRLTLVDVTDEFYITPRLHDLDEKQVGVIRDFVKQGKPLLACFGPLNVPGDAPGSEPDGLEPMLAELGIRLANQTVLFDAEKASFAQRRAGLTLGGGGTEVPPLEVRPVHPIGRGVGVTVRGVGERLNLIGRHPRPVDVDPSVRDQLAYDPSFLYTDARSWNESKPFLETDLRQIPGTPFAQEVVTYVPRYEPTPRDDPNYDTPQAERRGPFSIGVALETRPPAEWYQGEQAGAERPTVRVGAIGHGGLFTGPELKPAQELLLLNTCNWLLGREDRIPNAETGTWQFPRVALDERGRTLWWAGTFLGLPALCAFVGIVVLMFRQVR